MPITVSDEVEVNVPASEAWKLYRTLQLTKIVMEALPDVCSRIDVVHGDGRPGTILQIHFHPAAPGASGMASYKEKFTVVDDEKRVKKVEVIEGGYLDLGFTLYRVRLEVIDKAGNPNQCITKATIEYEVKEEAAANASLVSIQPLTAIMKGAADYLLQNQNHKLTNKI